jgi:hypothetical protein
METQLETQYRFIGFRRIGDQSDQPVWECYNSHHNSSLGTIQWYAPWAMFVYAPVDSLYSMDCLVDITDFLAHVNAGER